MNTFNIPLLLRIMASFQLAMAGLNLFLVRILGWHQDLARTPLLLRQVFQVHVWFISFTLVIFGVLTWRFAGEIATRANPACQWLAAGIGLFWMTRTLLQVIYYSSTHWRGRLDRTLVHALL